MFKRKPSIDLLIKSACIFVLMVLSVIGIIFGSIRVLNNSNQGASYQGAVSTTVYFSPYEYKDPKTQEYQELDYTKNRQTRYPDAAPMSNESINIMLQKASENYANRLYAQGFNQVNITSSIDDTSASSLTDVDKSWLLPGDGLPSLTITVNKILEKNDENARKYQQQVIRQTLFDVARNYNISLQTTDGYVIFNSNSPSFIKDSIKANQPTSQSSNDSTVSFELNLPSGSSINTDSDGAYKYIDSVVPADSDYNTGNGQSSVEKITGGLFPNGANGNSNQGNGIVVLWNDKAGALAYVRYIFDIEQNSKEWFSLSNQEQALWNFLHRSGDYSTTANTNLTETNKFNSASDITLNDLYYIYAVPKAMFTSSDGSSSETSTTVSAPVDTRTSRGGSVDFSGLFSPYILYEARTKDINGKDISENTTLKSLFPTNQKFNYGGNAKVVLSQELNSNGTYVKLDYNSATKLATLLKNGINPPNMQIFGAKAVETPPKLNSTLAIADTSKFDAFGSSILALGIILLLIGIIVSVFYKIPGLFNFVAIFLSAVLTFLLYTIFGGEIDLFSFFGLFGILSVGIGCNILINETFRRNVRNSTSLVEASRLAYNSTFMKVVDVHLITLVLGLFLLYLGHYQEQSLGTLLLVGSFCSFFITYGLSTLSIKIFMACHNWRNYKLFVYKRDARWLNKISGQINPEDDKMSLNNSVLAVETDNLSNFFNQNYKLNFLSKKLLFPIIAWIIAICLGIASLVLFSQNLIFNLSPINQNSGLTMFISAMGTFAIGLVYFALRYRWIVIIPYLCCGIINFFTIMVMPWIFHDVMQNDFAFENILFLFLTWMLGHVSMIFSISWNYNYWSSYVAYQKASIEKLISNNIMSGLRLFIINWLLLPFSLIVFSAFNFGGNGLLLYDALNLFLFIFFGISIISVLFVNLSSLFLFSQLLGLMMIVRQNLIAKFSRPGKHKKTITEYDRVDEQIIPGINQRTPRKYN